MQGQWRTARTCSSSALWPRLCGRRLVSVALWCHQRRRSGGRSATDHSVAKLSGRLFLPHYAPSRPIGTRSYSGVVPLPSMLFSTTRGGLRRFGTEAA